MYKLSAVTANSALKWDDHVAAIKSKAAERLWFLKKLKRAGVSVDDLIVLLPSCHPTTAGVRECSMALQSFKRTNTVA